VKYFSAANLPDSLMNKGALKITVSIEGGQLFNIWNVHLQDGASPRVRSRQLSELIGWIQHAHDHQIADIVGGDFNLTPDSSEFRELVAAIGPDVHQLAGDTTFPTWDGLKLMPGGGQALDHIFIRMRQPLDEVQARPRRVFTASRFEDRLSDHLGMEAVLTFGGSPEDRLMPVVAGRGTPSAVLQTSSLTSR
jgi:endonuclease/exonuclease/phosphatase family metal-dependent hydrolase